MNHKEIRKSELKVEIRKMRKVYVTVVILLLIAAMGTGADTVYWPPVCSKLHDVCIQYPGSYACEEFRRFCTIYPVPPLP